MIPNCKQHQQFTIRIVTHPVLYYLILRSSHRYLWLKFRHRLLTFIRPLYVYGWPYSQLLIYVIKFTLSDYKLRSKYMHFLWRCLGNLSRSHKLICLHVVHVYTCTSWYSWLHALGKFITGPLWIKRQNFVMPLHNFSTKIWTYSLLHDWQIKCKETRRTC